MKSPAEKSDVVRLLQDLVRIPSHESEGEVVRYLSERFEALGIPYTTRQVGDGGRANFIATWGEGASGGREHGTAGPARSLIFNSHTDTVSPGDAKEWNRDPFSGDLVEGTEESGDRICGRGAADAKGPLAAMIAALESIVRSGTPLQGRLILTAVAFEESNGLGTQVEVFGGTKADAAIVGEPTGLELHIAHKGVARIDITTRGKPAHASEPWEGTNAISKMGKVILALDELSETVSRRGDPLLGKATLAVTRIDGGIGLNVVPPRCTISLDRRLLPSETPEQAQAEIEVVLRRLEAEDPSLQTRMSLFSAAEAASTPEEAQIVQEALRGRTEVLGAPSKAGGFAACCDMWHLKNQGGIPTVILGPGKLNMAHKRDEYIEVSELKQAVEIYRNIALRWLVPPDRLGPPEERIGD